MTTTARVTYSDGTSVEVPARRLIVVDDTVSVRGERGAWVVGSIRPANANSHAADQRVPYILVTRTTGRREITSTSMWIPLDHVVLTRKGNADGDLLAAMGVELPRRCAFAAVVTMAGDPNGTVAPLVDAPSLVG